MKKTIAVKMAISALALPLALLAGSPALADVSVKLGILNDRSGIVADSSGEGSVIAAELAVEDFQAASKGINVHVVAADHQNKPDVGLNIARGWFDQDNVDVILDVPISSIAFAVSSLTKERNKILITSTGGSSELTGARCSPNTFNWTYDTWSLAHSTGTEITRRGGKTWFLISVDYAFGHQLQKDTTEAVESAGGKVIGAVRTPFLAVDMSSFLLQAQSSGADVIGLANGTDQTRESMKQSWEFGLQQSGKKMAAMIMAITDVKALGLEAGQGLLLSEPFYWDLNDRTRAFTKRFSERNKGRVPTMFQAGVYSATLHYLKAVAAAGTKDTEAVLAKMKSMPTDDDAFGVGAVLGNGRKIHAMHLFEVKKPAESKGEWDLYKLVATTPAESAFLPVAKSGCAHAQGK